jgi:hypothetical protein
MYRPSGMTVVTAGLGALVLVHVVSSWGTRRPGPRPQQSVPATTAALDAGATFQLHSGAWRAWPAAVEDAVETAPGPLAAPEAPAAVLAETPPRPDRSMPIQQTAGPHADTSALPSRVTHRVEPSAPTLEPRATGQDDPSAPLADKAPPVPPAEGRMALAGPEAEAAHPPGGHVGRSTPTARATPGAHEGDPVADAPAPSETKFGPQVFKRVERNGF